MDRQQIDDQHVVARYLADQLSDADREAFETYCREHPEMFREMEAAARFKVGLAKLDEVGRLETTVNVRNDGAFQWRRAAAIGGILLTGAILWMTLRVSDMGTSVAAVSGRFRSNLPVAADYKFIRMRDSNEFDQHIALPAKPSALRFHVLPDEESAVSYIATLKRDAPGGAVTVATAANLVADGKKYVTVFVRSEKLAVGTYSLYVEPEDSKGSRKSTAFRFDVQSQR